MNKEKINNLFSNQRLRKFFERFPNDPNKAIKLYKSNILVSKSLYPLLSIIEIALRNNIHKALTKGNKTEYWYDHLDGISAYSKLVYDIQNAKKSIRNRNEEINSGKVIAELTFGFWSSLFNSEYERLLWKSLRFAFPNMPKRERKRSCVSAPINRIRKLRNRVYHYEPI